MPVRNYCRWYHSSKDGWPDLQVHQYDRLRPEVIADITEVFAGTPPEIVPNRDTTRPLGAIG